MKRLLFTFFCGLASLQAQTPSLVKDINPNGDSWGEFLDYDLPNGNRLLIANDGTHGYELWITDGTTQGTLILKEINPNGDAFVGTESIVFKDELYFFADDGIHGAELWKTDGTSSGTILVKDIKQTGGQANPDETNFVVIGDQFYFVAGDDTHGKEVWVSDGTEIGTKMFVDINPTGSINGMGQIKLSNLNASLVFIGKSGARTSLWNVSTKGDTTVLGDFPSTGHSFVFEDRFYFQSSNYPNYSLVVTDGTKTGTMVYKSMYFRGDYVRYHDDFYFLGDNNDQRKTNNLWKISAHTHALSHIKKISSTPNNYDVGIDTINDQIVFFAEHDTLGYVLYNSDGTASGTKMLYDFDERVTGDANDYYATFYHFENELYISAQTKEEHSSLFKTDGTNVHFLYDFNPKLYGDVWSFATIKNELYMVADGPDVGYELFKYDGSTTGLYDNEENKSILFYPNPAHDYIRLSISDAESIKIIDLSGHLVSETKNLQAKNIIDVSSLDKGMYVLDICTKNKEMMIQKFVKD